MDKNKYINDMLLSFYKTIPSRDLDGIVSQFEFAHRNQYPKSIKLLNTKQFKKFNNKEKIEKLIGMIDYNISDDYALLLIDSSYSYYNSNMNFFAYENYNQAVENINKENYIYLIIYIIYKYCKPPYKAKLNDFFKTIQKKAVREQQADSVSSISEIMNDEINIDNTIIKDEKMMKYYIGYIEKKITFYNFKPEYEFFDERLVKVENIEEKYPKYGKINLSYKHYSISESFLENLNIDNNDKFFNNLYVLKAEDTFFEDNVKTDNSLNENIQKKIDLEKISACTNLSDIISPIENINIFRIVTPTSTDIEESFMEDNILINENYDAKTQALLLYNNKLYGPYTIEGRSYDSQKYIKPELINSKDPYLRKYIDVDIADILKIACNDGYGYSSKAHEIEIAFLSNKFIYETYEDLIPENVLAEELGKIYTFTINSDKDNYSDILKKLVKSSKFFGDALPETIRQKRIEKSKKLILDLQNLLPSKKALILKLLNENEEWIKDIELCKAFENFIENSEKYNLEKEKFEDEKIKLNDLIKQIDELRNENIELKGHIDSIPSDEYSSNYKEQIEQLNKELLDKSCELEEYRMNSNIINENKKLEEKNKELKELEKNLEKLVEDQRKTKFKLEEECEDLENDIQQKVKNVLKGTSEADVVFNPYVTSVMLDKVTELQKSKNQSNYESMTSKTSSFIDLVNDFDKDKAIDYLVNGIQKYRNYERNDIINIFICISQSFLTIFAGNPGTGKTSICNILGHCLGLKCFDKVDNNLNRFIEVSVERGWSSKRDLIGYFNPLTKTYDKSNGKIYAALKLLDAECRTEKKSEFPFYILLDEANLSPIEYYWAEFMSIADYNEDRFTINIGEDDDIQIPETLHFLATINNDQTTEPLSPRLLDRAWVIKLPEVSMDYNNKPNLSETFTEIFSWKQIKDLFVENTVDQIKKDDVLESIYSSFTDAGLSVSPRIKQSIRKYISVAQKLMDFERNSAQGEEVAIDFAILQKLLPKINGNVNDLKKLFTDLKIVCSENHLFRTQAAIKKMEEQQERNMGFCQYLL